MTSQSFADYIQAPGVHWSSLKHIEQSPLDYKWHLDNPDPETDAMRLGRATHTAVLEPDRFPLEYVLAPFEDRRGNKWKDFVAEHAPKTVLLEKDYEQCLAIRDAVRGHPAANELLVGESEFAVRWNDGATGLACKARIDHHNSDLLVDLKTTATFEPRLFAAIAARLGYHKQLAFYRQGLVKAGYDVGGVLLVCAQSAPPHDVRVYSLPTELLDYAWTKEVRPLLDRLYRCERKDEWPGAAADVVDLELPLWAYPDEEPLTQNGEVI